MTWSQVEKNITPQTVAILPIGAIEQHGFGPLGTDYLIAQKIAELLADQLSNSILMPPLPIGMSHHHTAYSGTLSFDNVSEFQAVVERLFWNLYRSGFRRIFVINGHGGNKLGIKQAIQAVGVFCQDLSILNTNLDYYDSTKPGVSKANQIMAQICKKAGEAESSHADAAEFSILFALMPEARNMMDQDLPSHPDIPDMTAITGVRDPDEWRKRMAAGRGGKGDPRNAQIELGQQFVKTLIAQLLDDATNKW